jgi:hypothetical protein
MRGWIFAVCLSACVWSSGSNNHGGGGERPDAGPSIDACVPVTCEQLAANCDVVADDGCGHPLDCGTCDAPAVCGGQGQANVCAIPEADRACNGAWCWEAPAPLPFDAVSMFAVTATDVWAVGEGGVIMHFDGSRWSFVPSGTAEALDDIWMASATDGWIVGAGGTLLRWNGTQWVARASGTTAELHGVWGDTANDVWFVGAGIARRWNGSSLVTPAAASVPQLTDVYVAPGGKVFATGEGVVWAYAASAWTAQTGGAGTFESYSLGHITGTGTKAFAIGRSYSFGSGEELIYQWDGASSWTLKPHPGDPEWTDAFADGGEVFGVSDESIIDLDTFDRTFGPANRTMVAATGAGGVRFIATTGGQLWQGQGGQYTTQSYGSRDAITAIADVGGVPWFGTAGGDVLEWRGGLVTHHVEGSAITAIAGTSRDDVWAATASSTYHFDGHGWTYVSSYGFTRAMHVKPDDVLLFGYHIWQQAESGGFTEVTVGALPAMTWRASYDLGDDVYAVGVEDAGPAHVIRRVAGTWSELPQPALADACGIAVAADDDIWIGGTGAIAHWDGSTWTTTTLAGTQQLCAIEVVDGEVCAADSAVHHADGTTEHVLATGAVHALRASGGSLWLGGDHGAVVRR